MQKPNNTSKKAAKKAGTPQEATNTAAKKSVGEKGQAATAEKSAPQSDKKQADEVPEKNVQVLDAEVITPENLVAATQEMWNNGWRFVTQTMVDLGENGFDVLYHFDKDLELKHFRFTVPKGATIPSISPVYFAALLIENENRDLFGVTFDGLVLDFNRTLYLEESGDPLLAPFCKISTFTKLKCEV